MKIYMVKVNGYVMGAFRLKVDAEYFLNSPRFEKAEKEIIEVVKRSGDPYFL